MKCSWSAGGRRGSSWAARADSDRGGPLGTAASQPRLPALPGPLRAPPHPGQSGSQLWCPHLCRAHKDSLPTCSLREREGAAHTAPGSERADRNRAAASLGSSLPDTLLSPKKRPGGLRGREEHSPGGARSPKLQCRLSGSLILTTLTLHSNNSHTRSGGRAHLLLSNEGGTRGEEAATDAETGPGRGWAEAGQGREGRGGQVLTLLTPLHWLAPSLSGVQ